MATIAATTVGCRLNQYETEKIADRLVELGMSRVTYDSAADVYILNTCTVTGKADADCRKLINRAYRLNPEAVIVVTGCYVVAEKEMISDIKGVDLIIGNEQKMNLPEILQTRYPQLFESSDSTSIPSRTIKTDASVEDVSPLHRPMVQIGTGCNQNCSYCIVPKVRGGLVSFPSRGIIDEIQQLVDNGYHEVILTAVHIGKYLEKKLTLAGLVEKILKGTTLPRLRLSSLEPNELDAHLFDLVCNHSRVCRHLHLPLQSGSDRILKLMRRPYDRAGYLETIRRIREANDAATVGCDVIIGFPGETEEDFEDTLAILNSGLISYGHIFSYSDRPGTASSLMPEKISPEIIKERGQRARLICTRQKKMYSKNQLGKKIGVISEGKQREDGCYRAVSDNYLKVLLPQFIGGQRHIIDFIPGTLSGEFLKGRIVS